MDDLIKNKQDILIKQYCDGEITGKQFVDGIDETIVNKPEFTKYNGKLIFVTNQQIWEMSKFITDKLKTAVEMNPNEIVDYKSLEDDWFDWLEDELLKH